MKTQRFLLALTLSFTVPLFAADVSNSHSVQNETTVDMNALYGPAAWRSLPRPPKR